jgi:hypothetical protein
MGFKRGLRNQYEHTSLLKIDNVKDKKDTDFYLGKRVCFVYQAQTEVRGSKFRTIWGRVTRAHGSRSAHLLPKLLIHVRAVVSISSDPLMDVCAAVSSFVFNAAPVWCSVRDRFKMMPCPQCSHCTLYMPQCACGFMPWPQCVHLHVTHTYLARNSGHVPASCPRHVAEAVAHRGALTTRIIACSNF